MILAGVIFTVRPLSAFTALFGAPGRVSEHRVIALFGIRGVGTFYYLAYAVTHADFPNADLVWATAAFVVVVSVALHGVAATPAMRNLDHSTAHKE